MNTIGNRIFLFSFLLTFWTQAVWAATPILECRDITISCTISLDEVSRPSVTSNCGEGSNIELTFSDDLSNLDPCGKQVELLRTWTAIDTCGEIAICTQSITIINEAPVIDCTNLDITIECSASRGENDLPRPRLSDDCSSINDGLSLTFVDDETSLNSCGKSGILFRTWTATDACGVTATCVQRITIIDTTDPIITCEPNNETRECNGLNGNAFAAQSWNQANLTLLRNCASDNCSNVTVTSDYDFDNLSDDCGNSITTTATFAIKDNTPPSVNIDLGGYVFNCTDLPDIGAFLSTRTTELNLEIQNSSIANCGNVTVTNDFDISQVLNPCSSQEKMDIHFFITDECNNSISDTLSFSIIDREINNPFCENLQIQTTNNQLNISDLTAPNAVVKVFDPDWQIIFNCSGDCPSTVSIPDLIAGETYHTDVQFYDEKWDFICEDKQDILIESDFEPCDTTICKGDVVLRTQAEVDAFCGCEVIEGNLLLIGEGIGHEMLGQPSDIMNTEKFTFLRRIKGNFVIYNTSISDLSGFTNLQKIGGTLIVQNNEKLENLKSLRNIEAIGKALNIIDNPLIEDLDDLVNLQYFENLTLTGNFLNINKLKAIPINKLTGLSIARCALLESLDGLENIDSIISINAETATLNLVNNTALKDIAALSNLKFIQGDLNIYLNPSLNDCCYFRHLLDEDTENGILLGRIETSNNAQFCNSPQEILQNCQTPPIMCDNIKVTAPNEQIIIAGLLAPNETIKVFDKDYNILYQCIADCADTQLTGTFAPGIYKVEIKMYDKNWGQICESLVEIEVDDLSNCPTTPCETSPPTLANIPADLTVECHKVPIVPNNISATDNCDTDVQLTFEERRTDATCSDNYILTRIWTATDDCGNTTTGEQRIIVEDTNSPILTNIPADITITENAPLPSYQNVTATDNCDANVDITVTEENQETLIVRTWAATDNCGNVSTNVQVITIIKEGTSLCEEIEISSVNAQIAIANIHTENTIIKVFDPTWQLIYECATTCENQITVPVEAVGIYHIDIQLYDETWKFICADNRMIDVTLGEPCDTSICKGDVVLRTQAEVDAFCGCEVIEGNLRIGNIEGQINNDIYSLQSLSNLKEVKGNLSIIETKVKEINSLLTLKTVGKSFTLVKNDELLNLEGLRMLEVIGENLVIKETNKLIDLEGLNQLRKIGDKLQLEQNDKLVNIDALKNLRFINRIGIEFCPVESIHAFKNIETRNIEDLSIIQCNKLKNLSGLEFIQSSKFGITLAANDSLENIQALSNVNYLGGSPVITSLAIVLNPNLSNCCSISHLIDDDLTNGVTEFDVSIKDNAQFCNTPEAILQNCQSQVNTPCEDVQIKVSNKQLSITNLTAPIEIIKIFDANYNIIYQCFADCEDSIQIADLAEEAYHINIDFYDKKWQHICQRVESVEIATAASSRNIHFLPIDFTLYPNPTKGETYINLQKLKGETIQLNLIDQMGKIIWQKAIQHAEGIEKINVQNVPNGLYFLQIQAATQQVSSKKILVNK